MLMKVFYLFYKIFFTPKKGFKTFFIYLFLFAGFFQNVQATHVVGGVLEYVYMGPGGLPNSSRIKVRLKLWRDGAGNPWFPTNPIIECRGDTMLPFDPILQLGVTNFNLPRSGIGRMVLTTGSSNISPSFIRDFSIGCRNPLDTVTVESYSTNPARSNTRILPSSGLPYYENPSFASIGTVQPADIENFTLSATTVTTTLTGSPANEDIDRFSNNVNNDKWFTPNLVGFAILDYGTPQLFNSSIIVTGNDDDRRDPSRWFIEGSNTNNGTDWVLLFTRDGNLTTTRNARTKFNFTNTTAYRFYRWRYNRVRNSAAGSMQVSEFRLGTSLTPPLTVGINSFYPAAQFNRDNHGYTKGVCNSAGQGLGDLTNYVSSPEDCDRFDSDPFVPGVSDFQRTCVKQNLVDSCSTINFNIRIQYAEYIRVVDLPNIPGGYHLTYSLCCRNGAVVNVVDESYSVYARIPDFSVYDLSRTSITSSLPGVLNVLSTSNVNTSVIGINGLNTTIGVNSTYSALSTVLSSMGLSTALGITQTIPGLSLVTTTGRTNLPTIIRNSSPSFKSTPPLFICQYNDVLQQIEDAKNTPEDNWRNPPYDHGAYDYDNDSLVYDIVSANDETPRPYVGSWEDGLTTINGSVFSSGVPMHATMPFGTPASFPNNVNISTFDYITYRTVGPNVFTAEQPFGRVGQGSYVGTTIPGISLDRASGKLICKPRVPSGLYVVAIRCREFRRGTGEFLGEITRDYQFNVQQCLSRASADALGNFNYNGDLYTRACNLNSVVITNNSSPAATVVGTYYWDNGTNRYSSILDAVTINGVPVLQRYDANTNAFLPNPRNIPVANSSTQGGPTFTYTNPGTYYAKLVVLNRGTSCADSAYHAINVSPPLRSAFSQVPITRVCVNIPATFDPFVTITTDGVNSGPITTGITTLSGNSLYTNPATNPIPLVWVENYTGIDYTVSGTNANDYVQVQRTTFTGWINHQWAEPNFATPGVTIRRPPKPAERTRIVQINWNFGDGVIQQLTLLGLNTVAGTATGTNWQPLGVLQPNTTILGFNPATTALGNDLFLPRIIHAYTGAGTNFLVTQEVISQFGCSNSASRTITVVQEQPRVGITGTGVCLNNPQTTLLGFVRDARGAIWTGINGTFAGANMNSSRTFTGPAMTPPLNYNFLTNYRLTPAELALGQLLNITLTSWGNGVCPAGIATSQGSVIIEQLPVLNSGFDATICGNNTDYVLNGSVTGSSTGGNFGGRWRIITSTGLNSGSFVGINGNTTTVLGATYRFSTSHVAPRTTNDKARGFVLLVLESLNNGKCLTEYDTLRITMRPDTFNPTVNAGGNITVCGNNRTIALNGVVTNSPEGGLWTSSGNTGLFGPNNTITSTVLSGVGANYVPSEQDSINGSVQLTLKTTIVSFNGSCFNVSTTVNVRITTPPSLTLSGINDICPNNSSFNVSGTITGASNAVWSFGTVTGGPRVSVGFQSNLTVMPNLVSLPNNRFSTSSVATFISNPLIDGAGQRGAIFLVVPANNGCLPISRSMPFSINRMPLATIPSEVTVCKNNPLFPINTFTPTIPNLFYSFSWRSSSNAPNSRFTPTINAQNITYNPITADTASGSVRLFLTALRGPDNCLPIFDTIQINYISPPRVNAGPDLNVCENNLRAPLSGSVTLNNLPSTGLWSTTGTGTFLGSGLSTSTILSDVYLPSPLDVSNSNVELTLISTGTIIGSNPGQCTAISDRMTINFTPIPVVNFSATPVVCQSNPADLSVTISGLTPNTNITNLTKGFWLGGGGSYSPNNNSFTILTIPGIGLSSVGNLRYTPSVSEVAALAVNLSLSVVGIGNCASITRPYNYNIRTGPSIKIINTNSPVCEFETNMVLNATMTGATGVIWTKASSSANAITASGNISTGFRATYTPDPIVDVSARSVKFYVSTQNEINNCAPIRDSAVVLINESPRVTVGEDINACIPTPQSPLVLNITGSVSGITNAGVWTTSGSGTFGQTTIMGGNMATTYTPSLADKGSLGFILLKLTSINNANCAAKENRFNLSFSRTPLAAPMPNKVVCINDFPIQLDASGSDAGSWSSNFIGGKYLSTNNNTSTKADDIFLPLASVPGGYGINFTWTTNATSNCPSTSSTFTTSVLSAPSVGISTILTITGNDTFIPLTATGTGFIPGYFTTNGAGNFTSSGISVGSPTLVDKYILRQADIIRGSVNFTYTGISSSGYCSSVLTTVSVLIIPKITVNAGLDKDFCADINQLTFAGQVFKNDILDPFGTGVWEIVSAAGVSIIDPTSVVGARYNILPPDLNVPRKVTFRLRATDLSGFYSSASLPTDEVTFTLFPAPLATITSFPVEVCSDVAFIPLSGTFTGAPSIIWSATGIGAINPANDRTSIQYVPTSADISLGQVRFVLLTQGSGVCSNRSSNAVTVSITGKPVINAGPDELLCDNLLAITLSGAGMTVTGTAPNVTWGLSNAVPALGTISSNIILTNNTISGNPIYFPSVRERVTNKLVTIFVTAAGVGSCAVVSDSKIITFYAAPTINLGGTTETFCGDRQFITLTGTTTVSNSGRWSAINGSGTFINSSNNGRTTVYSVSGLDVVNLSTTLGFQFTTTFAGCNNEFANKNIVLTTIPGVTITGSNGTINKNPTICGDNLSVNFAGLSRTGTGTWSSSLPLNYSLNSGSLPNVLVGLTQAQSNNAITTGLPITVYLSSGATGVCAARLDSAKITITQPPLVNAGIPETFCENIPNITLTGATVTVASGVIWSTGVGGGTFSNGLSTMAGVLSGSGLFKTVNPVVFTPSTLDRNSGIVIITLRTTGSTIAGICREVPSTKQITFVKAPILNSIAGISRCASEATTNITAVTQFVNSQTWYENGTGAFRFNTTNPVTYDFSTTEMESTAGALVTITVSALGDNLCPMVSQSMLLTITPRPTIGGPNLPSVCSDSPGFSITGMSQNLLTTGVKWSNITNPANTATNFFSANELNPIFQLRPSDITRSFIELRIESTNNGACTPAAATFVLNITPRPTITITGGNRNICSDDVSSVNGISLFAAGIEWSKLKVTSSGTGRFSRTFVGNNIGDNQVIYYPSERDVNISKRVTIKFETLEKPSTVCGEYFETTNFTFTGAPILNAGNLQTACFIPGNVISLTGSVVGTENYIGQWKRRDFTLRTSPGVFLSSNNENSGTSRNVTVSTFDVYRIGSSDVQFTDFSYVITGTGVCAKEYSSQIRLTMPKPTNLTLTGPSLICNDQNRVQLGYFNGSGWNDPSLDESNGESLKWSGRNSLGSITNDSDFGSRSSITNPFYILSDSDKLSNFILFTATTTGVPVCPAQVFTVQVNLTDAPRIQSVTGVTYCDNKSDGIPVAALVTFSGSNTSFNWRSNGNPGGNFQNVNGPTVLNSLSGLYFPSGTEFTNNSVRLIFTLSKSGCKDYTQNLDIIIKKAPEVKVGGGGSICILNPFDLNGSVSPFTTSLGINWSVKAGTGGSNFGIKTVSVIGINASVVQNTTITSLNLQAGTQITYTLTAIEPGCEIVSADVTYERQNSPQPQPVPQTLCGSNIITMQTLQTSALGTWSTAGLGFFKSTNSKTSDLANDIYLPAFGESGNVLFYLTSKLTSCGPQVTSVVAINLLRGMYIKAAPKKYIAICKNVFPELKGTVTGTTISKWISSGQGTFNIATNALNNTVGGVLLGSFTTTGSPNVPIPHYEVKDTYIPSQSDKDAGKVILTMEAISDGSNTCDSNSDTLSLIFTQPPTADAKSPDREECANTAISTLPGFGVSVAGVVLLPTPNSIDELQTPTNAAYWEVIGTSTGYFLSTKNRKGRVFSFTGTTFDYKLPVEDVFIASTSDTATANQPILLQLKTDYIGTITGASCNPAVDTVAVTFTRAPIANILTTLNGICADVTEINIFGRIRNASKGIWSHNRTGSFSPNNEWTSVSLPIKYSLSQAEINTNVPIPIEFNLVSDENGKCFANTAFPLTVTIYPKPAISISTDQSICSDVATISVTGFDAKNSTFTSVTGYTWDSNGNGTFAGFNRLGANLPGVYTYTPSDESFGNLVFTLSVSGQSTCKSLTTVTSANIVKRPKISVSPSQSLCRDIDEMGVNATIFEATGVQWSAFRCINGNCNVPATGTFTGNSMTSLAGVFVPSLEDRDALTSVSGIFFSATTTGTYASNPQCNQIITSTSINFIEIPTIQLNTVPPVCADAGLIPMTASVTGALGMKWFSSGDGQFNPNAFANALPFPSSNSYQLSAFESNTPFENRVTITGVTDGNGTCKTYSASSVITITGRPLVNAGDDRRICKDAISLVLTVPGNFNNPSYTITGVLPTTTTGFIWISRTGGTFDGLVNTTSTILGATYFPSSAEKDAGRATLELALTGPNPCSLPSDFMNVTFENTPNVVVSAGADQEWCAGKPLINLAGVLTNVSLGTNGWFAIKPFNGSTIGINLVTTTGTVKATTTVTTNSFCGTCLSGRGSFSDLRDLESSYFPSIEDTLGATQATFTSFSDQKIWIVLTVNGINECRANTYSDTMQVTYTSRPVIQVPSIPEICDNDTRAISLTGIFLNPIAKEGVWSKTGSTVFDPSNLQINPPTVSGVTYFPTDLEKDRGSVSFTFTTQQMGTCEAISSTVNLKINQAPKFTPAVQNIRICESQTMVGINISGTNIQIANWRSSGSGLFTSNNSNPGGNLIFTGSGSTLNDGYIRSQSDIDNRITNLFVKSTSMSGCFFGDSALVVLEIDKLITVDAGLFNSYCADEDTISLKGTSINSTSNIWTKSANGLGRLTSITSLMTHYLTAPEDRNLAGLTFYLSSTDAQTKCPVARDSVRIELTPLPIISISNDFSICTITSIQIRADTQNVSYLTWKTAGSGVFSTSNSVKNPLYAPSQSDITALGTNLYLTAKGNGKCGVSTVSLNLELKPKPIPDVNAGQDQIVCREQFVDLNIVGADTRINTYTWMRYDTVSGINTLIPLDTLNPTSSSVRVFATTDDSLFVLKAVDNKFQCVALDTVIIKTIILPNLGLIPQVCYTDTLKLPAQRQIIRMPTSVSGGKFQWTGKSISEGMIGIRDTTGVRAINPGLYTLDYRVFGCSISDQTIVRDIPRFNTRGRVVCKDAPMDIYPFITTAKDSLVFANTKVWDAAIYNTNYGTNRVGTGADTVRFDGDVSVNWNNSYNITNNPISLSNVDFSNPSSQAFVTIQDSRDSSKYYVRVSTTVNGLGCFAFDTIRVKTHPKPQMTLRNYPVCLGDTVFMNATPLTVVSPILFSYLPSAAVDTVRAGYNWSFNGVSLTTLSGNRQVPIVNNTLTVTEAFRGAGTYVAQFTIGECIAKDTSVVSYDARPIVNNEPTVKYCIDETGGVRLDAGSGNFRYLWLRSGNTSQFEQVYDTLTYYFKVFNRNNNCSVLDSVEVKQKCDPKTFTPEAFIPNGPNPEDRVFRIFGKYFREFRLRIYNRWGELIFESKTQNEGWDGNYNGSPMPIGSYPYTLEYKGYYDTTDKVYIKKGAVTLIR